MNILLLSVGRRNKLVQYFRNALQGTGAVVAADSCAFASALYEADRCQLVPPITDTTYLGRVLALCEKERIGGVVSLIDPEVSVLAAHAEAFRAVGATPVVSDHALCEMALDKSAMYRWLAAHGYSCAPFWTEAEDFRRAVFSGAAHFPAVIKPLRGSGSHAVTKLLSMEAAEFLTAQEPGWLIQEWLCGQEIGADVYADLITGEVVSVFTKKKLGMRAGETDRSVSFWEPRLCALLERFVSEAGFRGVIDIDLFERDGSYLILDVNLRFGGGYPHAHACGCDFTKLIVNNLNGIANERRIGDYEEGVCMMKYSDVTIRREVELVK